MTTPYQFTQTSLFSPTQISGCSVWLDAADRSSITLSGSNVSQWNDKSGNGMTVSAASAQPVYLSNAQNRLGALNFDGTKNLTTGNVLASKFAGNTVNLTIFCVFSLSNTVTGTNYAAPFCWANAGSVPRICLSIENTVNGVMMDVGANSIGRTSFSVPPPTFDNKFYFISYFKNGVNTQLNLDGLTKSTTNNQDTTQFGSSNYAFNVGNGYANSAYFMRGNVGEILFYNNTLSTANFQQVEGYLAWKWGLQGSLPTTHPYKTTPVYANPPFPLVPRVPTFTSATIYNPTSIPNCVLWLDASDRTTLFTDSAGTIPVTASGQTVSCWKDKSTANNSATNTSSQPTVVYSGANNLSVLNFTGSQFLSLNGTQLPNGSTPFTYFFLVRTTSSSVQVYYTHGNASIGQTVQFYYNNYLLYNDLYGAAGPSDTTPYNSVYVLMDSTASSTLYSAYDNGNPFANGAVNISLNTGSTFAYIGCGQIGGTRTYFLIGQIAEVIAYNRVLSTSERQQVEAYIQWKWGLQSTIPSTNPYTIAPPYQAPSFPLVPRVPAFTNKVFNPTSIAGCSLWLDAADKATFTYTGANINTWADKSGLGNTATATGTIPMTASINTIATPNWSGAANTYFAGSVINTTATLTAFSVFLMNNVGTYSTARVLSLGKPGFADFNNTLYTAAIERFNTTFNAYRNSAALGTISANFDVPVLVCSQFNGSIHTIYLNGIAGTSVASTGNFGYTNYEIGTDFTEEALVYLKGTVGEVLTYNLSFTTAQRQQVEGYLAWKWGLQSSLPNNHPYKLFPPSP